jgi:cell division protein FtsL
MAGSQESPAHCQKTSKRRFEARTVVVVSLALAMASLVGWLYLTQTSHLAVTGYHIMELEQRQARLQEENAQLEAEIAELESASQLMARAQAMGFQSPEQVAYVPVSNYPMSEGEAEVSADRAQASAPADSGADASSALDRWWTGLVAQFDAWLQAQP